MQEVFEKIIEKLENELKLADEEKLRCARENPLQFDSAKGYANGVANAIEIVKQEAEQYNNGWIPVSEKLPEANQMVLATEKDSEYVILCCYEFFEGYGYGFNGSNGNVIAWMELPSAYRPKEK